MATAAQTLSAAPKPLSFAAYDRLANSGNTRTEQLFEALHHGLPKQSLHFEQIIRQYAIAQQRKEFSHQLETSFISAVLAAELSDPTTAAEVEKFGEAIVLGRAIKRDAEGANVLAKIMRYQSAANKELARAEQAYQFIRHIIRANNQLEKTKPILPTTTPPASQPAQPTSAETPRNALCPCGSGQKYKRCCGTTAPAVLCNRA